MDNEEKKAITPKFQGKVLRYFLMWVCILFAMNIIWFALIPLMSYSLWDMLKDN